MYKVLFVVLLSACASSDRDSVPVLAATEGVAPGEQCPAGGVRISGGADGNRNGTLDAGEVTATSVVCNGVATPAYDALVRQVAATTCAHGGTRIEYGLDNGDGGGVARDGILADGEVDGGETVCNGEGRALAEPVTPPAALNPQPVYVIDTHGANAPAGVGGSAGKIALGVAPGSLLGHVKVFNTGSVDTSFTAPQPVPSLGAVPFVVPAAPAPFVLSPGTVGTVAAGAFYYDMANGYVAHSVNGVAVQVTGLHVPPGRTLQVDAGAGAFTLTDDLVIEGALVAAKDAGTGDSTNVIISAATIVIGAQGTVDTNGAPGTAGSGGNVVLSATAGSFIHRGALHANGSNGRTAGNVTLTAARNLWLTGEVNAVGGNGTPVGGSGGDIALTASNGSVFSSGILRASTGSGPTVGRPGSVSIRGGGDSRGDVVLSGRIEVEDNANACTDSTCTTVALRVGVYRIEITAYGGEVRSAAELLARVADRPADANLGNNAGIRVAVYPAAGAPAGSLSLSGNLRTHALRNNGGAGGTISLGIATGETGYRQELALYGYAQITANGGAGIDGGQGGAVELTQDIATPYGQPRSSAGIVNYAAIDTSGGAGTGAGGNAGRVLLMAADQQSFEYGSTRVLNFGALTANGGNAGAGGFAGEILLSGYDGVENHGAIEARVGHSATSAGVTSSSVRLLSNNGTVLNSASVTARGGDAGTLEAGNCNVVELVGRRVHNTATGSLHCDGGNSVSGAGGAGGAVYLTSHYGDTVNDAPPANISVSGGSGAPAGPKGFFILNGVNATGTLP